MSWLSQERYEAAFESETAAFVAAAERQDLGAVVPTCPEWTYRDLIGHVGTGHRYAAGLIAQGAASAVPFVKIEAPEVWQPWVTSGARELIDTIRGYGFDKPVWTWQTTDPVAGFWLRRMLHDLVIHRFDADPAGELDPGLAADGISDMLATVATMAGGSWMKDVTGRSGSLQLRTPEGAWHVTVHPGGVDWREGEGPADETVTGSSLELLLVLNRRRPSADPGPLLTHWLTTTRF
jgi:uncharacterized protein (TIGR03083 family)